MTIKDLVIQATQFLKATSPTARLDAEIIISDVLQCDRPRLHIDSKKELPNNILSECLQKIERRIQGEPVAYIINKKDFLNHNFFVQEGVLIPRPETELLVEYSLHWIEENCKGDLWILDIGCGSGNIGISLLKEVYSSNVFAVDISKVAIETTIKNATNLNVLNRLHALNKDADQLSVDDFTIAPGFNSKFDLVISNPPYIDVNDTEVQASVRKYEPHEALFCESNGLEKIRKWTQKAAIFLKPGGLWIFEIGYKQAEEAMQILRESLDFEKIEVSKDYAGLNRFVFASKINHDKISSDIVYQS